MQTRNSIFGPSCPVGAAISPIENMFGLKIIHKRYILFYTVTCVCVRVLYATKATYACMLSGLRRTFLITGVSVHTPFPQIGA